MNPSSSIPSKDSIRSMSLRGHHPGQREREEFLSPLFNREGVANEWCHSLGWGGSRRKVITWPSADRVRPPHDGISFRWLKQPKKRKLRFNVHKPWRRWWSQKSGSLKATAKVETYSSAITSKISEDRKPNSHGVCRVTEVGLTWWLATLLSLAYINTVKLDAER